MNVYKIPSGACREKVTYDKDIIGWFRKIDAQQIDPSCDNFLLPFLCLKHTPLFTPMYKFFPLVYGQQTLPLTKDDIYNVRMIMMQCELIDKWSNYPLGIHIRPTTTIKFMLDRNALRFPPLDLRKKKVKFPPHKKPMPHPDLKDNVSLRPIPYDWSKYFINDVAKKIVALKLDAKFDQNDAMLFDFEDMYEISYLASTLEYDKEDTSNHTCIVQILHPAKIYRFSDWKMCFLRQEEDNESYQHLIHDTLDLRSRFVFDLYKYSKAVTTRVIVTAWA